MPRINFKIGLTVDPEFYVTPVDDDVEEELIDMIQDLLYEVDGVMDISVTRIKGRGKGSG
jgi:hypothetical protein|tara:strand:- start:958 stop:1137 length:180 start_codon:yes stop_codon:yes gene_type:complete